MQGFSQDRVQDSARLVVPKGMHSIELLAFKLQPFEHVVGLRRHNECGLSCGFMEFLGVLFRVDLEVEAALENQQVAGVSREKGNGVCLAEPRAQPGGLLSL